MIDNDVESSALSSYRSIGGLLGGIGGDSGSFIGTLEITYLNNRGSADDASEERQKEGIDASSVVSR